MPYLMFRFIILYGIQVAEINITGLSTHACLFSLTEDSFLTDKMVQPSKYSCVLHNLQGAATTCYVALSGKVAEASGRYFADCNESHCSTLANDEIEARNLWNQTRALIHKQFVQP